MIGLFGLFWLLIPLAITYMGVRAVWVSVTLPRRIPREAACGNCAYPVAGLTRTSCPECGSDFRTVGISTPRFVMRWRGGYATAIVGWTIVMLMVAMVGTSLLSMLMVTRAVAAVPQQTTNRTMATLSPPSNAYRSIRVDSTRVFTNPSDPASVSLLLTMNDGSKSRFEFVDDGLTYTIDDGSGPGVSTPYDDEALTRWFNTLGIDTDDPAVASELESLVEITGDAQLAPGMAESTARRSGFIITGTSTFSGNAPAGTTASPGGATGAIIISVVLGALFLIWIGGIIWICLRRSKLLAAGA